MSTGPVTFYRYQPHRRYSTVHVRDEKGQIAAFRPRAHAVRHVGIQREREALWLLEACDRVPSQWSVSAELSTAVSRWQNGSRPQSNHISPSTSRTSNNCKPREICIPRAGSLASWPTSVTRRYLRSRLVSSTGHRCPPHCSAWASHHVL